MADTPRDDTPRYTPTTPVYRVIRPDITYIPDRDLGTIEISDPDHPGADSLAACSIQFQHGPVGENGVNGIQNEDVLKLLAMRLRALNAAFPCRENSIAITKIEEATLWLEHRTAVRVEQGVEGKNEPHTS
jgi:hypothetical protein